MHELLQSPFKIEDILKKKKKIKRELMQSESSISIKIAILGGATTNLIKEVLELFLLDAGITPVFYESEYNKWYEDAVFQNDALDSFQPQIILVHTSTKNIIHWPFLSDSSKLVTEKFKSESNRFLEVWTSLQKKYHAVIIQDNFVLPDQRILGNLSFTHCCGNVNFVHQLNCFLSEYASNMQNIFIHDVNYLSSQIGLNRWLDSNTYYLYKMSTSFDAVPYYCHSLAQMIKAIYGKSKKCIVLDLDNTLWGGVIGDDGINGIQLGNETALGEAFQSFQRYLLKLKERGILLAVCSKNDESSAKEGLTHPDSLLKLEDFTAFIANWEPKHLNLVTIAKQINIGLDSLVFIDDNPVERQIVRENLPLVEVPEVIGGEPESYIAAIEDGMFFETISISEDDLKRNETYRANQERETLQKQYTSYEDFLKSLHMKAEISAFSELYLDRIAQLTNKTNQFNLTTKRYTRTDIENIMKDGSYITLYCRLNDKFGDNGIISLIIAHIVEEELQIELWLMSCRVLKRNVEDAMFNALVNTALSRKLKAIRGFYYRTPKNGMVADLYKKFGFTPVDQDGVEWYCNVSEKILIKNIPMEITYDQ